MMIHQSMWLLVVLITVVATVEVLAASSSDGGDNLFSSAHPRQQRGQRFTSSSFLQEQDRMTIHNMTCSFFTQPLNHFVPRGKSPTYEQRYCIYSGFANENNDDDDDVVSPIFFYTGNESPLEQYINHTGLMWELAADPSFQAHVVFAEHRYEGASKPFHNLTTDCMSYASSIQALADYSNLLEQVINPGHVAPVIAFGGSYGGMLSAWFRMKYPHQVAGAIAASAPIGGFPQAAAHKLDGAARVVKRALDLPYPPTNHDSTNEANHCSTNLLAAWPLIQTIADYGKGKYLQDTLRLCTPPDSDTVSDLLDWAQAIWFDLAEGSFPYPSSYIPYALLHKKVELPAWPLQAACYETSDLHKDHWGVQIVSGNVSDVRYNVSYANGNLTLQVNWDQVAIISQDGEGDGDDSSLRILLEQALESPSSDLITGLLENVRDAVSIWYNVTKDVQCYDFTNAAPNTLRNKRSNLKTRMMYDKLVPVKEERRLRDSTTTTSSCQAEMDRTGSWEPLCCNDELNLIITEAAGVGGDFYWPPSHAREIQNYDDLVQNTTYESCPDPDGIFGYSSEPIDPYSTWMDSYYGGTSMDGHSKIIFSNGLLDPWSAGGIYAPGRDPTQEEDEIDHMPMIQNITNREEDDLVAVLIELGGHHTDLMYSDPRDPPCVVQARAVEREYILKWIDEWRETKKKRN